MSEKKLAGKKIAVLATDGFEQSELFEPRDALIQAGAKVDIVSINEDSIKAWKGDYWAGSIEVDVTLGNARADFYDALLLPGGVMSPDKLRTSVEAVKFVKAFVDSGKPIAAICHGPWTLIETGKVSGRKMTSWHSIRSDLENAGAQWVDEEVVVDHGWVTSRKPDDLPVFIKKMIEEFSEGVHKASEVA